jgi:glycine C-acetyltransferase
MSPNTSMAALLERFNDHRATLYKEIPDEGPYYPTCYSSSKDRVILRLHNAPEPREFINFSSGSYFNLGHRPEVRAALIEAYDLYGCGSGGSPTLSGYFKIHEDLERDLAAFAGLEEAVLFSSGYGANLAAHASLLGPADLLVIDESSHGSAFDGAKIAQTNVRSFVHNDPDSLQRVLRKFRHQSRIAVVSTCGVFTMGSEISPLPDLVRLAHAYDALFLLDDAHATGVLGATGRGSFEHFGLDPQAIDILVGVMGKTLGCVGGYIVSSAEVARYLRFTARPHVLSTSLPPTTAAAAFAALGLVVAEGREMSSRLRENARYFRTLLQDRKVKPCGELTGVVTISLDGYRELWLIMEKLLEGGIFCNPVIYPAVRYGEARLRFHLNLNHRPEDLLATAELTCQAYHQVHR